ncbi:hypothetical protein pipiens_015899 [Culex pipiens pipiens]|uniref:Uncharacterized protein n=1 Tax=Culex pipiens pipiens TaxID=38569 RepID=A0ABD1CNH4_CULPP
MSYIAQIWDPFGLVGPTTLKAKLFMQRLWALKHKGEACAWDTPLPLKIQLEWKEFHMLLHMLSQVKVPRSVATSHSASAFFPSFVNARCNGAMHLNSTPRLLLEK